MLPEWLPASSVARHQDTTCGRQFLPWACGEYPLGQHVKLAGPEDIMSGFSHVTVDPLRVNLLLCTGREAFEPFLLGSTLSMVLSCRHPFGAAVGLGRDVVALGPCAQWVFSDSSYCPYHHLKTGPQPGLRVSAVSLGLWWVGGFTCQFPE